MTQLRILFIEDDETLAKNLKENFQDEIISGYTIKPEVESVFEKGITTILSNDYDLVILDLYNEKEISDEEAGIKILNEIRKNAFVPVIFYTGYASKLNHLISEIVGVVNKGDGIEELIKEIQRIIDSKIALIKNQVHGLLKESLRKFFWETVDTEKQVFVPGGNDISLGYLLLRRFANSLTKENIRQLLRDDRISTDKVHPMEFYIYPSQIGEYEAGEIISRDGVFYAILTPSCDFISEGTRQRKVEKVLLAEAIPLKKSEAYIKYEGNKEKFRQGLKEFIESRRGDRYFFLPKTPFIENLFLDFQYKSLVKYDDLKSFERIAKLDDPFAQSMISSFIRYYNRIGSPDIDSKYIIDNL